MKKVKTFSRLTYEFESWGEFIAFTRPYKHRVPAWSNASHAGATAQDADAMADHGWYDGAHFARQYYAQHIDALGSIVERIDVNYEVHGHVVDIARFVEGEPECWQQFDPVRVESPSPKFMRVVVNIGASGGVSAQTILARGAALCALVDLLEMAGVRCEVAVVDAVATSGKWYCQTVLVKPFEQPLDLPRVAYAIGHPSVLRVHTFRLYERMGVEDSYEWRSVGYGAPADVPDEQRGDIYVGRMHFSDPQWRDPRAAQAWIVEQLKSAGVTLREVSA